MSMRVFPLFVCALFTLACGARQVDDRTASFAATLGQVCESHHDCSTNQRCLGQVCELDTKACLANTDCGSQRCEAGYCSIPSPALMTDEEGGFYVGARATPDRYLKAGNDGLVDNRGGLVLEISDHLFARIPELWWGDWKIRNWKAETKVASSWRFVLPEKERFPERFIFEHKDSTATMVVVARLLESTKLASRQAPIAQHFSNAEAALATDAPFEEALMGVRGEQEYKLERVKRSEERIGGFDALRIEAVRNIPRGAERMRIYALRSDFGDAHFTIMVGLCSPIDEFTDFLDDFSAIVDDLRFGGVDPGVGVF